MYVGSFGRGKVTSYAEMSYGAAVAAATKLHTHTHGAAAKHLCVASRPSSPPPTNQPYGEKPAAISLARNVVDLG